MIMLGERNRARHNIWSQKQGKPRSERMNDITHRTGMPTEQEMTATSHHRIQMIVKITQKTYTQRAWMLSLNEKLLQNLHKTFWVYQINSVKYIDCSHKCAARISKIGMIVIGRNCWNAAFIRRTILYCMQMGHTINIKHWNAVFQ